MNDPVFGHSRASVQAQIHQVTDRIRGWEVAGLNLRSPNTMLYPLLFGYRDRHPWQVEYIGGDSGKLDRLEVQVWLEESGTQGHAYNVLAASIDKLLVAADTTLQVLDRYGLELFENVSSANHVRATFDHWNAQA